MSNKKLFLLLLSAYYSSSVQATNTCEDKSSDPNLTIMSMGAVSTGNKPAMLITMDGSSYTIESNAYASDALQGDITSPNEVICDLDDENGKTCR